MKEQQYRDVLKKIADLPGKGSSYVGQVRKMAKEALDEQEQPEECKHTRLDHQCSDCKKYVDKGYCEQPEEPTLWDGDWIASRIQAEYDKHWKHTSDWSKYAQAKIIGTLKSKLRELAEEMRMEEYEENTGSDVVNAEIRARNATVREINKRLDTFISKLQ